MICFFRWFKIFVIVNWLISCQFFTEDGSEVKSNWIIFNNIQPVKCLSLPTPKGHLGLLDFQVITKNNQLTAFWARSADRSGRENQYIYRIEGGKLEFDESKIIPFKDYIPKDPVWIGSEYGYFGFVNNNEKTGQSELVLKDIDEKVGYQSTLSEDVFSVNLNRINNGFLIQKELENQCKLEIIKLNRYKKLELESKSYTTSSLGETFFYKNIDYLIYLDEKDNTPLLEKTQQKNFEKFDPDEGATDRSFKIINLKTGDYVTLPPQLLLIKESIESWALTVYSGKIYLAYTRGDSLIGKSQIEIFQLSIKENTLQIIKRTIFNMEDAQLSELQWGQSDHHGLNLYFLQWLDSEATLARYHLGKNFIQPEKNMGVFHQSTMIVKIFTIPSTKTLHGLIRYQKETSDNGNAVGWHYQICDFLSEMEDYSASK